MLAAVSYTNNQGQSISLNTYNYPLEGEGGFAVDVHARIGETQNKMFAHGEWPTRTYAGGMTIDLQGSINFDDSDDYNAGRVALLNVLRGNPDVAVIRKSGTLTITLEGMTEPWKADVRVEAFTAPLGGASPSRSPFLLTLYAFLPYFIGVNTGTKYWYG